MIHPDYIQKINLYEFNYELPKERIAEYPLENRSDSKLLFADIMNKNIIHHKFSDLPELIPADSMLIMNTTKVIPARIYFKKQTGGIVELLLIEPSINNPLISPFSKGGKYIDPQIALSFKGESYWLCIIGGKRVKEGMLLLADNNNFILKAEILKREQNEAIVKFKWFPENLTFSDVLTKIGKVPLPPYINRDVKMEDKIWYQTVYAEVDGSVAAPTAGFHFTDELLNHIRSKNILMVNVVLHVGPGTFKPIETDNIFEHEMHTERISISKKTLENIIDYLKINNPPLSPLKNRRKRIIATGTTTLRTLETLYWLGCKILFNIKSDYYELSLEQWEAYEIASKFDLPDAIESLESIVDYLNKNNLNEFSTKTSLFIIPGYDFKVVNGLITNYHLPKSSLILLVSSFAGKEFWKEIYDSALKNDYRFLSYGDSSLITNY